MKEVYQAANNNKLIPPSSFSLLNQIQAAEAKFQAAREQASLRREALAEAREVRAQGRAARGRFYAWIQGVEL